jgi:predicted dehydrogenase
MNHPKIRWGIMGCGRIARKFASDLQWVKDAELAGVASRSLQKAREFSKDFPARYIHGSYEELAANSEIDVIYVATPHSHHYENTLLCLRHNKAVLCEKPFAINSRQAQKMIQVARRKKLFLMEAVWTKFLPHYQKLQALLKQNKIGDIKSVLINFGFRLRPDAPARLLDPALGGGTLLDIGIYNVFMALSILGKPDKIEASIAASDKGIDEQCAVQFVYKNGAMAQLFSSFTTHLPIEAYINGTKGNLKLTSRFYEPSCRIELYREPGEEAQAIPVKKEKGFGYQYEARHVNECLKKGLMESPVMTHQDTLLLMKTLDTIRKTAGIAYAAD